MGLLYSRYKYHKEKNKYTDEEVASIIDYSSEIKLVDEKADEIVLYMQDQLVPIINELKTRIYYLETNNNELKRKLNKIETKKELFYSAKNSESELESDE